jgi:hypothetical protein
MRNCLVILLTVCAGALSTAGCGGDGGGSRFVGGPSGCGQVAACGGDLVGTWDLLGACVNQTALSSSLMDSGCPGASISISNLSIAGSLTLNADNTYSSQSLMETFTFTETVPGSCLGGQTCAQLNTAAQSAVADPTSGIQSVSCSGIGTCVCTFGASVAAMGEAGTYQLAGNNLITTPASTGTADAPTGYCVQGTKAHFISVDATMHTGPMGTATITSDLMAQRR